MAGGRPSAERRKRCPPYPPTPVGILNAFVCVCVCVCARARACWCSDAGAYSWRLGVSAGR